VPVRAGRFVIHGSHDRARVRLNEIGIEIEAALAFGTGHHGTTRGCLLAFEAIRKRARNAHAWHILDIGTGTGVLAIAAARALTIPVLASDIDPMAVAVARENARLNHVPSLVAVFTAAGAHAHRFEREGRYDLIFANILEAPLRRMSAAVTTLLAPGGYLILSGLLPAHAIGVIAAYRRQGLLLRPCVADEEKQNAPDGRGVCKFKASAKGWLSAGERKVLVAAGQAIADLLQLRRQQVLVQGDLTFRLAHTAGHEGGKDAGEQALLRRSRRRTGGRKGGRRTNSHRSHGVFPCSHPTDTQGPSSRLSAVQHSSEDPFAHARRMHSNPSKHA
jgi:predicted O-methyltransferase YrrM